MTLRSTTRILLITAAVLMIPLLAMEFSPEMNWGPGDFIVVGGLVFAAGVVYELVVRRTSSVAYRAACGLAVLAALTMIVGNLAVGMIGSADNPANLMYAGVLAVGLIGALAARFRPRGMARALFATALAQLLVLAAALTVWRPEYADADGISRMIGANIAFAALFAGSALLFRRSPEPGGPAEA